MHPHLIGPVKSFGLLLAVSFVAGILLSVRRGRGRGLPDETVADASFTVLVASLIGVRLFFVLTHLDSFDPWYEVFMLWKGGLTLYGGILGAIAAVVWFCRRHGVPFLKMADVMAPQVVLGIGLTRLGCFLNGCCYGRPTDGAWGIVFPSTCAAGAAHPGEALVPSQLLASGGGFLIWGLLLHWERFDGRRGGTFGRFLLLYGVMRYLVDLVRDYEPGAVHGFGLTTSQVISVGLVAVGSWILVRARGAVRDL